MTDAKQLTRSEFAAMSHDDRMEVLLEGGEVIDEDGPPAKTCI